MEKLPTEQEKNKMHIESIRNALRRMKYWEMLIEDFKQIVNKEGANLEDIKKYVGDLYNSNIKGIDDFEKLLTKLIRGMKNNKPIIGGDNLNNPICGNCQGENAKTGFVEVWDGICPDCGRKV